MDSKRVYDTVCLKGRVQIHLDTDSCRILCDSQGVVIMVVAVILQFIAVAAITVSDWRSIECLLGAI